MKEDQRLTDITPHWSNIADVVVPYDPVDEDEQVGGENPADVEDSDCVPCAKIYGGR